MAHQIYLDGGQAAMFYVDEEPWHGLGTRLERPPTSCEAIKAARLDWTVAKVPLCIAAGGGTRPHELPHRFAIIRQDTIGRPDCHAFGIAGREYIPLQNYEAFEFFDPLVAEGDATYETAGALGRGERVWIQARLAGDLDIAGDEVRRFLLLSNSHEGTRSVQVKITPVRVVCNNTLTIALSRGTTIRVRHDRDMMTRLERAKALLGLIQREYDEVGERFRRLAATELTRERALKYFADVFPSGQTSDATRRAEANRRWAAHFFEHGAGNQAPSSHRDDCRARRP
jgi:phage/plasmid-like protein (TIGR03299 family)